MSLSHRVYQCATWALVVGLGACGSARRDGLFDTVTGSGGGPGTAGIGGGGSGPAGSSGSGMGGAPVDAGAGGSAGRGGAQLVDSRDAGSDAQRDDAGPADAGPAREVDGGALGPPTCTPTPGAQERCDGLDNDCDGQIDPEDTCAADCRGFAIASSGYMFCADGEAMDAAQFRCQLDNMRLAWLETAAESRAVAEVLAALGDVPGLPGADAQRPTRIGATDEAAEGDWSWSAFDGFNGGAFAFWSGGPDGSPVGGAFANWAPGKPNNLDEGEDCGVLLVFDGEDGEAGQWNDIYCSVDYAFVCETVP